MRNFGNVIFFNIIFALLITAGCNTYQTYRLFNGKDLNNWLVKPHRDKREPKGTNKWVIGKAQVSPDEPNYLIAKAGSGEMINLARHHRDSLDIYSEQQFGDCRIELEVMVPRGSNSGIYVMGEYEVQILDSFGVKDNEMKNSDMGAIYGATPPKINACKAPGKWQKYVIEFLAPKFDEKGKKIANAKFLKVELNGKVLHKNLEMPGPTPGGLKHKESPTGPIMFQGDHGSVAYRNIKITEL